MPSVYQWRQIEKFRLVIYIPWYIPFPINSPVRPGEVQSRTEIFELTSCPFQLPAMIFVISADFFEENSNQVSIFVFSRHFLVNWLNFSFQLHLKFVFTDWPVFTRSSVCSTWRCCARSKVGPSRPFPTWWKSAGTAGGGTCSTSPTLSFLTSKIWTVWVKRLHYQLNDLNCKVKNFWGCNVRNSPFGYSHVLGPKDVNVNKLAYQSTKFTKPKTLGCVPWSTMVRQSTFWLLCSTVKNLKYFILYVHSPWIEKRHFTMQVACQVKHGPLSYSRINCPTFHFSVLAKPGTWTTTCRCSSSRRSSSIPCGGSRSGDSSWPVSWSFL